MSVSGYTCIRIVFCWVNVLFWITGCGLLGVGLWLRIAYEGYASLLPQYALLSADSLAITFGTVTFIFSFFACCGSWFQNRCMLITYFCLVVFIFLIEFVFGAVAFIFRESLKHTLSEELQNGIYHHYNMTSKGPNSLVQIWDNIQTQCFCKCFCNPTQYIVPIMAIFELSGANSSAFSLPWTMVSFVPWYSGTFDFRTAYRCFGCCGVTSYDDWYKMDAWPEENWVPDSCCLPANYDLNCGKIKGIGIYTQGCYAQINNFFIRRLDIIGFVGILIAFFQLYGLISSMMLFCTVKHKRTSRTYKSYS